MQQRPGPAFETSLSDAIVSLSASNMIPAAPIARPPEGRDLMLECERAHLAMATESSGEDQF